MMRRSLTILAILISIFSFTSYGQNEVVPSESDLIYSEFVEIESLKLSEIKKVSIHLPKSYFVDKDKRYSVLYLLDGENNLESTRAVYSFLSGKEHIPELIIVSIPHNSRNDYYTYKRGTNILNSRADDFLDFFSDELIPLISSKYRSTNYKIISGHSAGGLFLVHAMIKNPKLFNAYFALSPSIHHTPAVLKLLKVAMVQDSFSHNFFYANVGGSEFYQIRDAFIETQSVFAKYKGNRLRVKMELHDADGHQTTPFIGTYKALKELYKPIKFSLEDYIGLSDSDVVKRYEEMSNQFDYEIIPKEGELMSHGRYFFSFETKEHDLDVAKNIFSVANHYYPESEASKFVAFIDKWQQYGMGSVMEYKELEFPQERRINSFGYFLLNRERVKEAIFVFELITEHNPNSHNAYDSLGEAYGLDDNWKAALAAYENAYAKIKDSDNEGLKKAYLQNIKKTKNEIEKIK